MMVTNIRGHFKDVRGSMTFDPDDPVQSSTEVTIDTRSLWTGEAARDAHLRSVDFLDVERYPEITFRGDQVTVFSENEYAVAGELTIRGITRPTMLQVRYLGEWRTPWVEDGVNKGIRTRAGFVATAAINRQDFGITWSAIIEKGGLVVGNAVTIAIDVEAVSDDQSAP